MWYCLLISFLMVVNVMRSFSVYRFGDVFNHALLQKVVAKSCFHDMEHRIYVEGYTFVLRITL